jgi:hypothetical protein
VSLLSFEISGAGAVPPQTRARLLKNSQALHGVITQIRASRRYKQAVHRKYLIRSTEPSEHPIL